MSRVVLTNIETSISVQLSQLPRGGRRDTGATVHHEGRPLLVSRKKVNVIHRNDPF